MQAIIHVDYHCEILALYVFVKNFLLNILYTTRISLFYFIYERSFLLSFLQFLNFPGMRSRLQLHGTKEAIFYSNDLQKKMY